MRLAIPPTVQPLPRTLTRLGLQVVYVPQGARDHDVKQIRRARRPEGDQCPLCTGAILVGQDTLLVSCVGAHPLWFPTCYLHEDCFTRYESPVGVISTLMNDYRHAKRYAYWFKEDR